MEKESKVIGVLYSGDPSHMQRHTQVESKKAGVAILFSDKTDFKPTKIKRDKEGHYIMVKASM